MPDKQQLVSLSAAAALGAVGYWLLSSRRAAQAAAAAAADAANHGGNDGEVDNCAICLDVPHNRCRTQCGHRFCLGCFRSWCERQVPPTAVVRCPLCMTPVRSLTAEFAVVPASAEVLSLTRWLWAYNLDAALATRMRWVQTIADVVRFGFGGTPNRASWSW